MSDTGQPSNLNPAIVPMVELLIVSIDGIADQLRDNGASEADARDIQAAADQLTVSLALLLAGS